MTRFPKPREVGSKTENEKAFRFNRRTATGHLKFSAQAKQIERWMSALQIPTFLGAVG